jgi:hypothetical protein
VEIGSGRLTPAIFVLRIAGRAEAARIMGGMGGEIRGKSKLEVYKRFRAQVNRNKIEESYSLFMDAGTGGKQDLYRSMKKDEKTGEWVLFYHFGK